MRLVLRLALAALLALAAAPAMALDPGVSSGHYARDGLKIGFKHAIALSQDNTEGLLDHGPQIRVVLTDVEVPIATLYGVVFPPVRGLGRDDKVHGVILEFSPDNPTAMLVTVLAPPEDPGASLTNISISNSEGIFKAFAANATRVTADYAGDEESDFRFSFNAPVFTDPVQADLKGPAAQASEQIRVLVARADAIRRNDLPAALALSSQGSALRGVPPEVLKQAAGQMPQLIRELKAVKRVVVRTATAVALQGDGGWSSLVLEDGAWKVTD